jgi:hypothetical protein
MKSEARLFTMFAGWIIAFYGVQRRSWPGTIIALFGLALADGAMTIATVALPNDVGQYTKGAQQTQEAQ